MSSKIIKIKQINKKCLNQLSQHKIKFVKLNINVLINNQGQVHKLKSLKKNNHGRLIYLYV